MSALEQTPFPDASAGGNPWTDRRGALRYRIAEPLAILVGRGDGLLVDLSEHGARVRHSVQARRASKVRVSFEWQRERFAATAEVLSSRVVALGSGDVPTVYESRLRFDAITGAAGELLARVIASVDDIDVRKWVANLRGWNEQVEAVAPPTAVTGSYLRCRLIGNRWERKWTHDRSQPKDGFALPESVETKEVDSLCETYRGLDEDGRHLIRLIATASL